MSNSRQSPRLPRLTAALLALYALLVLAPPANHWLGGKPNATLMALSTPVFFAFALLHGRQTHGWRRTLAFLALTFGVSLAFESAGVATGRVYGGYHYTNRLGPKFLGLVPYLIPLAWFMMMYCAWELAGALLPGRWRPLAAALAVTAWDLLADPLMVRSGHWVWEQPGPYFGIPVQNYAGWLVTALCIYLPAAWLWAKWPAAPRPAPRWFSALPRWAYAVTWLSSVLALWAVGLSGPALAGFFGMGAWAVLAIVARPAGGTPEQP
ncbi:MAG: carotenoid biosynthesis protein [Chloroflexi bacterium]|nr:carotenoid biosynthesis protein [Chloroflexota bacterium]